jgi:hypothetical protein
MTRFVERPGEVAMRPPLAHRRTHMRCFWFRADRERLAALCDLAFAGPSGGAVPVEPLGDGVALVWAEIAEIRSLHPLDAAKGCASEVDVALWIPVKLGSRTVWYIPWLWVDSDLALILGREMYGFPKRLGRFSAPPPGVAGPLRIEGLTVAGHGEDRRAAMGTVLEVRPAEARRRSRVRDVASVFSLSGMLDPLQWIATARTWRTGERPRTDLVFLRQLRDVEDPGRAAFQEIVEAPCEVEAIHSGGLLPDPYELILPRNASLPIADALGLRIDGHPIEAAFEVTFDFVVGGGKTLWRSEAAAPARRPSGRQLRSIAAFAEFSETELDVLADEMRVARHEPGHVFLREGQENSWEGMFVLLEGQVDMVREESGHAFAKTFEPGDVFGVVALVDRGPRTATCTAGTACLVANLDRAGFEALRRGSNEHVARKLQWVVARQLARDFQAVSGSLRALLGGR